AERVRAEARDVAQAGAALLVLEGVPAELAATITAESPVPTIGIGAGPGCDGQGLVLHGKPGPHAGAGRPQRRQDFLAQGGSVAGAVEAYVAAVRDGSFPGPEHSYA